ncbi:MAG: hypothetical protein LBU26_03360 [Synergistaceae bacterium]|nr:hypothetical protein [Synergistaceae bacterium]
MSLAIQPFDYDYSPGYGFFAPLKEFQWGFRDMRWWYPSRLTEKLILVEKRKNRYGSEFELYVKEDENLWFMGVKLNKIVYVFKCITEVGSNTLIGVVLYSEKDKYPLLKQALINLLGEPFHSFTQGNEESVEWKSNTMMVCLRCSNGQVTINIGHSYTLQ